MRRPAIAWLVLSGAACVVSPADWAGRLCDDAHACFDGRVCVDGRCVEPGTADGGAKAGGGSGGVGGGSAAGGSTGGGSTGGGVTGGGSAGGGSGSSGGGSTGGGVTGGGASGGGAAGGGSPDGGVSCITWTQARDGFSSTRVAPLAMLSVEADAGSRLTARIPSASNTNDFALAVAAPPSRTLPPGAEGQLEGRFLVPMGTRLDGLIPFVRVLSSTGPIVEVGFDNNWELSAFTAANVLQAAQVSRPRSAERFDPGTAHTLRVAWRAGAFRRVWIDGAQVFDDNLTTAAGLDPIPTALELGFPRYEGGGQDPMSMTLSDWVLCDSALGTIR